MAALVTSHCTPSVPPGPWRERSVPAARPVPSGPAGALPSSISRPATAPASRGDRLVLPSRLHVRHSHGGPRAGRERGPGARQRWAGTGSARGSRGRYRALFWLPRRGRPSRWREVAPPPSRPPPPPARPSWPFVGCPVGRAGRVWWLVSAGVGLEIVNNPPAVTPPLHSGIAEL